jgi:hypothetical protein
MLAQHLQADISAAGDRQWSWMEPASAADDLECRASA